MPVRKTLGEVFQELPKKIKHADKIAWLRQHASPALFYVLTLAYRDDLKFALPEGAPPFKPWKGRPYSEPTELQNELRRLYIYLEGAELGLRQWKRELMFQRVLESLPAEDVRLLLAMKDKTATKEYRTPVRVIEEAFPGLLSQPFNSQFIRR
jgi:hypothetical protein